MPSAPPAEVDLGAQRRAELSARLRQGAASPIGLRKRTSNLFRDRSEPRKQRLDLSAFRDVLAVDPAAGWVDAGGLATFESIVAATLPHAVMPAVVPQLKTITIGGATAGVGIEATSFRQGLVHDSLLELEVLLPGGDIVLCTPTNEHRDLFYGFPNSYGTLGYALRLRQRTIPIKPCVEVMHLRHHTPREFFAALAQRCAGNADFVDGVVFGPDTLVLSVARFVDEAPFTSDYKYEYIYYRSLLGRELDYLSAEDYIWRWDTDWFWCSRNFGAQNPLVRRLFGRKRLNSRTYTRLMRWNARWGLTKRLDRLRGRHPETVIQDIDIPISRAAEFLDFLLREIGILPIWICPIRAARPDDVPFTLYPMTPGQLYVNFGFWDQVVRPIALERGHFNRSIERETLRLGGIKSLYSDCYFDQDEFDRAYHIDQYRALKAKYDPRNRALGLYEKCVQRA